MIYFLGRKIYCSHGGILIMQVYYSCQVSLLKRATPQRLPHSRLPRGALSPAPRSCRACGFWASRDSRAARGRQPPPPPPAASSFQSTPRLRWLRSFSRTHCGGLGQAPEGRLPSGSTSMTPWHVLHHAVSQCTRKTGPGERDLISAPQGAAALCVCYSFMLQRALCLLLADAPLLQFPVTVQSSSYQTFSFIYCLGFLSWLDPDWYRLASICGSGGGRGHVSLLSTWMPNQTARVGKTAPPFPAAVSAARATHGSPGVSRPASSLLWLISSRVQSFTKTSFSLKQL